ncbi:hypothetical protein [Anaerococcus degeneri]|uniref:Uncharacterized protein n=1 Tax=Anaerococcus degeneri TaxID=361500 RepID=A0ABS7YYC7_9FIRM|nr:hypothetical protein [Anaerococcus degeneri]MBP2016521.1 hypothetical protein [Anaerococcus degeneri]MCA2096455.1 hypothetical protein [Anaerococcus degeneri]
MLEAKNDNKDRNDIDIADNTAGTVGFDPKTGKVFYVDEPKKAPVNEPISGEEESKAIAEELFQTTDAIIDLLKEAGIEDPTDLEAIRKLAEEDK